MEQNEAACFYHEELVNHVEEDILFSLSRVYAMGQVLPVIIKRLHGE